VPVCWATLVLALAPSGPTLAADHELDGFVAATMRDWDIPGLAIAVVLGDKIIFSKGYGVREIGRPDRVDANTTFGIGSVTKSFTATGAAMLVDDEMLAFDAPLIDYLPQLHFQDPWITGHAVVRDLTSHRLGIDELSFYLMLSGNLDTTLQAVRHMRPAAPFRTFLYSNVGYALLGKTIEAVSGRSWEEFTKERIFKPLGMNHSYASEAAFIDPNLLATCWLCTAPQGAPYGRAALNDPSANMASPHALVGQPDSDQSAAGRVQVLPWRSERSVVSAGMIHSSVRDMAQYMRLHLAQGEFLGRRLVSAEQMKQIHSAQVLLGPDNPGGQDGFRPDGYGMGWIVGTYRGLDASHHGGGRAGFGSYVWLFPGKGLGVVVLENLDFQEGPPLSLIALRFAEHYLGLQHLPSTDDVIAERLAKRTAVGARSAACSVRAGADTDSMQYAGAYRNEMFGEVRIVLEGDHPVLQFHPGSSADLRPHAGGFLACFRGPEEFPTPVAFTHDSTGEVSGFVLGAIDPQALSSYGFSRIR